jgi:hypothetical protein
MRLITDQIYYDKSIQRDYFQGSSLRGPSLFLEPGSTDWAIIPTHRGRSYHDLFYSRDGLPRLIAEKFLMEDAVTDHGYALIHKRVIGFHAQNGYYYQKHKPYYIDFRQDAIWGDYYYAGLYECVLHALKNGCQRLAFFATYDNLLHWQWCALVRASQNAMTKMSSGRTLSLCNISTSNLPQYSRDEEILPIPSHDGSSYIQFTKYSEDIDIITFTPKQNPLPLKHS